MFDGWMKIHDKESTVWPSIVTKGFKASSKEKNSTRYKYHKIDKTAHFLIKYHEFQ